MNDQAYEFVLRLAVEEATAMVNEDKRPQRTHDSEWDEWHQEHFGRVLTKVDKSEYSFIEARDISQVCEEVENDIRHGDILGL